MKTVVVYEPKKCSGCWACTMTCADQNDLRLGKGDFPYRLVKRVETGHPGVDCVTYHMKGCMHCEEAACMEVCPMQCFSKTKEGLVVLNDEKCVQCQLCVRACPKSAIQLNAEGLVRKCDGCFERVKAGLRPACECICPSGAIHFNF